MDKVEELGSLMKATEVKNETGNLKLEKRLEPAVQFLISNF
jgi:hypothetical protein